MAAGLNHEEPARGKRHPRMAQKRQYGSGQLKETRNGWVIRWWEIEIAPDGTRQKWALTPAQAAALIDALPVMPQAMVGLAILSGLRRGEVFALRWRDIDLVEQRLTVRESVYDGHFGTPKTEAGIRQVPLSSPALKLMSDWKERTERTGSDALVFGTAMGTPLAPNNVLRRHVYPACKRLGLPRASWLTFRRTFSTWSHQQGVSGKVTAQLMRQANVDTTINVYKQVLDGSVRDAVERVGRQMNAIERSAENSAGDSTPATQIL